MSTYEVIIVIFTAMGFTLAVVTLMVHMIDKFSKRK